MEGRNMKVVVRIRPYNNRELEQKQRSIISVVNPTTIIFDPRDDEDGDFYFHGSKQSHRDITKRTHKELSMHYDRIFDTNSTNAEIFEECAAPLVDSVLKGYNCSIFVYGATGAGKTFTMLGNHNNCGITYLTLKNLLNKIKERSDTSNFRIGVTFVEVYSESVVNLITKEGPLRIVEDCNGEVIIRGLVPKPISNAEELLQLLAYGNANRTQHPTDANAESSRSHAIFRVHIQMTDKCSGNNRRMKLSMIDLAGSERASTAKTVGKRFKEGANINKSLLALGNCINKLAEGLKHIPYRDSNLTRILKDSLSGNCQTLMVANISMSSTSYEDTYNTLKYASRAKKIRAAAQPISLQSNLPKAFYVQKLQELLEENERIKKTINNMSDNQQLNVQKTAKDQQKEQASAMFRTNDDELKTWINRINTCYANIIKIREHIYRLLSHNNLFNFRESLKYNIAACRKIITTDENEHYNNKVPLTVEKEMLRTAENELVAHKKRLQHAVNNLEGLKSEVNASKYSFILQEFLKSKELEVKRSKENLRLDHTVHINNYCLMASQQKQKLLTVAFTTLKRTYDRQTLGEHDPLLERDIKMLHNTLETYETDISNGDWHVKAENKKVLKVKRALPSDDEDNDHNAINRHDAKRSRICDEAQFATLQSDHETTDSDNENVINTTFKVPPVVANKNGSKFNETLILSEQKVRMPSLKKKGSDGRSAIRLKMPSTVLQPSTQKENKTSSPRVVNPLNSKSTTARGKGAQMVNVHENGMQQMPRIVLATLTPSTSKKGQNLVVKAAANAVYNAQLPLVRSNRAAFFRLKK